MGPLDRYTCEEIFRRLDDYLDRELGPEEVARVNEHLALCAGCAAEYRFEERVLTQIREKIRRLCAPPDLLARIHRALSREPDAESRSGGAQGVAEP